MLIKLAYWHIGILTVEALLRAADRGVTVCIMVEDLQMDAPDKSLLAHGKHPNVEIRIYNPQHSAGTPFLSAHIAFSLSFLRL